MTLFSVSSDGQKSSCCFPGAGALPPLCPELGALLGVGGVGPRLICDVVNTAWSTEKLLVYELKPYSLGCLVRTTRYTENCVLGSPGSRVQSRPVQTASGTRRPWPLWRGGG